MLNNPIKKLKEAGVKIASPSPLEISYATKPKRSGFSKDLQKREAETIRFMNQAAPKGLDSFQGNPITFFKFDEKNLKLQETKEAYQKMRINDFYVYDIENLGSHPFATQGTNQETDWFTPTQLSLHKHSYSKHGRLEADEPLVLAMQVSGDISTKMEAELFQLEKDPSRWNTLSETKRRSLIDLSLYENKEHFQKEILPNGKKVSVLTGQKGTKPSIQGTAAVTPENIHSMRQGLRNITDSKLTNSTDQIATILDGILGDSTTLVGHNNLGFDKPGLQYALRNQIKGSPLETKLQKAEVDTLALSRAVLSGDPTYKGKDFRLGTLYENLFPGKAAKDAHYAGADTGMTGEIFDYLVKSDRGRSLLSGNETVSHLPRSGESFIATSGFSSYYQNPYKKDQNRYSMVMRQNPETGEWMANNGYQQMPINSGREYNFLGVADGGTINGVKMHALILEDVAAQTANVVLDSDYDRLISIFQDEMLVPKNQMDEARLKVMRRDTARRTYEGLFDSKMRGTTDSSVASIEEAYDVLNKFDTHYNSLLQKGSTASESTHNEALRMVHRDLNRNKEPGDRYLKDFNRIQNIVEMKDTLEADKAYNTRVIAEAKKLFPSGHQDSEWAHTQQQNIYVKNMFDKYYEQMESPTEQVGYEGMKLYKMKMSIAGEVTHADVSSKTTFQSSVRRILNTGNNQGPGMVQYNLETFFGNLSAEVDDVTKTELRKLVREDLRSLGKVSQRTIQQITNQTFESANDPARLVQTIGVRNTNARFGGAGHRKDYANRLASQKDGLFDRLSQEAREHAASQLQTNTAKGSFQLSGAILDQATKTQDILDHMTQEVFAGQTLFGMDTGEIKKERSRKHIRQINVQKEIEKTVRSYEDKGFNVGLVHNPNTKQSFLAFAFQDKGINLATMDFQQMDQNAHIGMQPLPFMNDNFGIEVGPGTVAHKFNLNVQSGMDQTYVEISSGLEGFYQNIQKQAGVMQKKRTQAEKLGLSLTDSEIIDGGLSTIYARNTDGALFTSFSRVTDHMKAAQNFSQTKAYSHGFTANGTGILEAHLQQERPEIWKDWQNYLERTGKRDASIMEENPFWWNYGDASLQKHTLDAYLSFNNTMKQEGIQIYLGGLNAGQAMKGDIFLRDPRKSVPLGSYNSSAREQIHKAENYIALEREPLEKMFAQQGLSEATIQRRLAISNQLGVADLDENARLLPKEKGTMGLNLRARYTNDKELYEEGLVISHRLQDQIDSLKAQQKTATSPVQKAELESQILQLVSDQKEVKRISVYDGQSVIRKSVADSITSRTQRDIVLSTDEVLPKQFLDYFAKDLGVTDAPENAPLGLKGKTHYFSEAITYEQMKTMELLDENGMLTVGTMMESAIAGKDVADGTAKRITKNAKILGIGNSGGKTALILEENRTVKETSKMVGGHGDGRYTTRPVADHILDYFSKDGKRVDMLLENSNVDKRNLGSTLNVLFDTVQENILEDLENIQKTGEIGTAQLKGLQEFLPGYLEQKQITTQDLSRMDIQGEIMEGTLFQMMKPLGLYEGKEKGDRNHVRFDIGMGRFLFDDVGFQDKMVGSEGQKNFRKTLETAKDLYSFDTDHVIFQARLHNVSEYAGTGTTPFSSHRERQVEQMTDRVLFGNKTSVYREHREMLRKQNGSRSHEAFAGRAIRMLQGQSEGPLTPEKIYQTSNIVFDLTGPFDMADGNNIRFDKESGSFVVNAASLGRIPEGKGALYDNTMGDPFSVRLYNKELGINKTLGEYLADNEGSRAYLKTQNLESTTLDSDFVEIIGRLDDNSNTPYRESHLRASEKSFRKIYNAAYDIQTITPGDMMSEEAKGFVEEASRIFAENRVSYRENTNQYLTSAQAGAYVKNTTGYQTQLGMNTRSQTYNRYLYDAGEAPGRMNEVFLSRQNVQSLVEGHEEAILRMNGLDPANLSLDEGETPTDYILRQLTGTKTDQTLELFSETNRYPTQGMGNLNMASLRIDNAITEGAKISPALAELLRADYDGDTLYFNLDAYLPGKKGAVDWKKMQNIQSDMAFRSSRLESALAESGEYVENIFEALAHNAKNLEYFKHYEGLDTMVQDFVVNNMKATSIGQTDNMLVATRQLSQTVFTSALDKGVISQEQYNNMTQMIDDRTNEYIQQFISAKKVTVDALGIDPKLLASLSQEEATRYVSEQAGGYMERNTQIIKNLRDMKRSNVEEFLDLSLQNKIIQKEDVDSYREVFSQIGLVNETLDQSGFRAMKDPALKLGQSKGDVQAALFQEVFVEGRGSALHTSTVKEIGEKQLAGEHLEHFRKQSERQADIIASNFQRLSSQNELGAAFSDAAEEQLASLTALQKHNGKFNSIERMESISQTLKHNLAEATDSTAFKVGAGFAAMWLVGSAIKKAPTPEGSEAQQEATPVEVAPSALLTSPTARVTPRGENVQLKISGTGNVDHNMIAGIVNEQISAQTGVPMQMNIQRTDNLTKLDKNFYESTISRILGV